MPDTAPVHTEAVTDTPDPVDAAAHRLTAHKNRCSTCRTEGSLLGAPPCATRTRLIAAWRRAVREAALNRAPLDCAPADGGNGQITTEDATR